MRNYAAEGWASQLQGRRVVGHYVEATSDASTGTGRVLSMRNPVVPAGASSPRQTWLHLIRAELLIVVGVADDATAVPTATINTVDAFTVSDDTGGSALAPTNLSRTGVTSVVTGQKDTTGNVSGGTLGTVETALITVDASQSSATGTDALKSDRAIWLPTWGPILLKGDQGIIAQIVSNITAPGVVRLHAAFEWLESEKQ